MPSRKHTQRLKIDPNFPKAPKTQWEQFAEGVREVVKKKFVPGDSAEDIMKTLQNEWAEGVSESERMGYCKRYRKKKVLHELVCSEYVKDKTGGPKRPSTAFFLFCKDVRKTVKKANPDAGVTQMAKLLGQKWKALNEKKQTAYRTKSTELKEAWNIAKKAYEDTIRKRRIKPVF